MRIGLRVDIDPVKAIAATMPNSQYPHMLIFLNYMEDNAIKARAFAEQQMPGRIAKLSSFLNHRAARRKLFEAKDGVEQTIQPLLRI